MKREHPLRAYRQRHGLSQRQMANLLGTTKVTVSRIETGTREPSGDLLRRIAAATMGEVMPNDVLTPVPAE